MRLQAAAGNRAVTGLVGAGARAGAGARVGAGPVGAGARAGAGPVGAGRAGAAGAVEAATARGPSAAAASTAAVAARTPLAAAESPLTTVEAPLATAESPLTTAPESGSETAAEPGPDVETPAEAAEGPETAEAAEAAEAAAAAEAPETSGPAETAVGDSASTPQRGETSAGLAAVTARAGAAARTLKQHPPAGAAAAAGVRAAPVPGEEREAMASAERTDEIAAAEPRPFDRSAFIAAVHQAIAQQQPRTLEEADELDHPGQGAAAAVGATVTAGQAQAAAPLAEATAAAPDTGAVAQEEATALTPPAPVATPALGAAEATPTPLPAEATDLSRGPAQVDQQMAQAGVTEEQLARSNEPELTDALAAKRAGEAHSASAPAEFRAGEAAVLTGARAENESVGAQAATAMAGGRAAELGGVHATQSATADQTSQMRARVAGEINAIFSATKTEVDGILAAIGPTVERQFTTGEEAAAQAFRAYHEREMDAFRERRYGGALGWTDWLADKLTSPPPEVNLIIDRARALYASRMTALVEQIADTVAAELGRASAAVEAGHQRIAAYLAERPAQERQAAEQAANQVGTQFAALETAIDDKAASLAEDLAARYVEATGAIDEQVTAMREENRGLIDRARDAVGSAVATILQMKEMLTGVLGRAAGAVEQIIADPMAFLGNFVGAVRAGVSQFVGNVATHLKRGLQEWLFGALAEAGIEVPETLDLKGVITLVLQLIGATWANLRARIVKRIGERAMAAVERGVEVIQLLVTKGIGGLWEWIAGKVTNLYEQVVEKIQDFVITKVITAGVTWLISLLNPAAAFIKACRMIYDAVMWFVENAARLRDFVGSVLDSVESIARGGVGAVAGLIENAMARTVPMIISGFASLLGLGGIAAKIKSILQSVQRPVGKLIDKVVDTAVRFGKRVTGRLAGGGRSGDAALRAALASGDGLLRAPGATPAGVRGALPALVARHGLAGARLVEADGGYSVEVQREKATTPRRVLGNVGPHGAQGRDPSQTPADQTKQSEHVVPYVVLAEFMRAATATEHDRASSGALDRAQSTVAIYTTAANLKTSREGPLRSGARSGAAEYYAEIRRQLNIAPNRRGPHWQAGFTELYASIRRYLDVVKSEFTALTKQAISDDAATYARTDTAALAGEVDRAAEQQVAGLRLLFAQAGRADHESHRSIEITSLDDVNTMHVTELAMVDGIGPRRAAAIVSERTRSPFSSLADLRTRVPRLPRSLLGGQ